MGSKPCSRRSRSSISSKVLDLPTKKAELGDLLVTDYHTITEDPSIDVVIECMGGDALPYSIITASLKAGKAVISSNKETISKHYKEYASLAQEHHAAFSSKPASAGEYRFFIRSMCLRRLIRWRFAWDY
jgi:homoserine dehydrogenase